MIKKITFEEIVLFWSKLWYNTEVLSQTSSIKYLGDYDSSYHKSNVYFYGWDEDNKIVGVNSCFRTGLSFRSRGLWVEPEYRGREIAQHLLLAVSLTAKINEAPYIWSMPRESALHTYEKFGFERRSYFFDTDYGPNCFVYKKL